ncbi:MAG TPA: Gfo/Idh/MocA family oxidoreductase [Candidatus Binatia bacterium]|nr:Gfo/Idh/MocA family oxidoreductase [Candidatus Binatia bacterium]
MLRLGIAGIGIAAEQVLPSILAIGDTVRLSAVADIRADAVRTFGSKHPGVELFDSVETLCACDDVDVVWISTPNEFHARHAVLAARNGKHVVCEKPMATSVSECNEIVAAVEANGVKYVQGHSKVYSAPVQRMREVIKSGSLGRVTQINTWNYNDWLIRPLTATEVQTSRGTGPLFRQGPHQVDMVRYLAGSPATSVRAVTGRWEAAYPETESDYTALLLFDGGTVATLAFNAQGYFDAAELTWGIGEGGFRMLNADSVRPRERRTSPMTPEEKYRFQIEGDPYGRGAASGDDERSLRKQPFFGITIVSCERGVIRQSPDGVYIYDRDGRREVPCTPGGGRGAAELLELADALAQGREPFLDAAWGRATLEVCVAILESSRVGREVELSYQAASRPVGNW